MLRLRGESQHAAATLARTAAAATLARAATLGHPVLPGMRRRGPSGLLSAPEIRSVAAAATHARTAAA